MQQTPSAPSEPEASAVESLPPGQLRHAGKWIAMVVFFGVIVATIAIVFTPERIVEREEMVRLDPQHVLSIRLVGDRGLIEIINEGPLPIILTSPSDGAPLAETVELTAGASLRRSIDGVGIVDVLNANESVTTVRWRGSGPEPMYIDAQPPRRR